MRIIALLVLLCLTDSLAAQSVVGFPTVPRPEDAGMSSERLQRIDRMVNEAIARGTSPVRWSS